MEAIICKQSPEHELEKPPLGARSRDGSRKGRRIRCPRCRWEPRPRDRWYCDCGMAWNTFDTHGLCPRCQRQWTQTACLACHRWSAHEDWYE